MHVNPQVMHVKADELVKELTEADLNQQKAGMRGILASRLELIWQQCEPYLQAGLGGGEDIRMMEIGLKVIDRQAKLHEVYQADRPSKGDGVDEAVTLARRQAALADLTALVARLGGEQQVAVVDQEGEDQQVS